MTALMILIGGILIGLGVGLMGNTPPDEKPKPKKKKIKFSKKKDDFWDLFGLG